MKPKDISGQRFGRLVAVENTGEKNKDNRYLWVCKCDCGTTKQISSRDLLGGKAKSCGCYNADLIRTGAGMAKARASEAYKEAMEKDLAEKGTRISTLTTEKIRLNNKSGTTGVFFDNRRGAWKATICLKGKRMFLGRFANLKDATNARKEAEEKYFKPILEKYGKSDYK